MLEPASSGSDSSSEDEPMEVVKQLTKKQDKKVTKTPVKQKTAAEDSDSSSSEEQVQTSKSAKKPQKSPAVTKVQNKTNKVTTKPVDRESSLSEEPVKPGKVRLYTKQFIISTIHCMPSVFLSINCICIYYLKILNIKTQKSI